MVWLELLEAFLFILGICSVYYACKQDMQSEKIPNTKNKRNTPTESTQRIDEKFVQSSNCESNIILPSYDEVAHKILVHNLLWFTPKDPETNPKKGQDV